MRVVVGVVCERESVEESEDEESRGTDDNLTSQSDTVYLSPSSSLDSTFHDIPEDSESNVVTDVADSSMIIDYTESIDNTMDIQDAMNTKDTQDTTDTKDTEIIDKEFPPFHSLCYGQLTTNSANLSRGELCDLIIHFENRFVQLISPKKVLNLFIPFRRICQVTILRLHSVSCLRVTVSGDLIE